MATEIKLPELGEGIESAQVLSVLVNAGDTVKKDQPVIEVETEKATAEVPTDFDGVVAEVRVKQGDKIQVGQTILILDSAGAARPAPVLAAAPQPAASAPAAPEPEPAPTPAPPSSSPKRTRAAAPAPPPPAPEPEPAAQKIVDLESRAAVEGSRSATVPASPSVRRLAREIGVDIAQVPGTGPDGRISEDDVKAFARRLLSASRPAAPALVAAPKTAAPELPDFTQWGPVEREPMTGIRRATAEAMSHAWAQAPMVTQFDRADITALEAFRTSYAKRAEAAGVKLTVTAVAVKVAAAALERFPRFNASVDLAAQEVILKQYVHVGVAVDTGHGLMVPVIRDANRKNAVEIAGDLAELAEKARKRKIALEDLKGGTFSVSNLGGLGTTYFSPIVNWPEVAILGLGRASVEAVYRDAEFVPRTILPLAVTYDHRLIDGADAARFLRWIAEALENPVLLAVEG